MVVVAVVGGGRCFFCVEETGLVDGFQDLKKHMIVCLFIYIYNTVERKYIFTPFPDGNDREMNMK